MKTNYVPNPASVSKSGERLTRLGERALCAFQDHPKGAEELLYELKREGRQRYRRTRNHRTRRLIVAGLRAVDAAYDRHHSESCGLDVS